MLKLDLIADQGTHVGPRRTIRRPKGTVAVKFEHEDLSSDCLNIGDGKATLRWRRGVILKHMSILG